MLQIWRETLVAQNLYTWLTLHCSSTAVLQHIVMKLTALPTHRTAVELTNFDH